MTLANKSAIFWYFCMFQKVVLPFLWRTLASVMTFILPLPAGVSPFHRGHRIRFLGETSCFIGDTAAGYLNPKTK